MKVCKIRIILGLNSSICFDDSKSLYKVLKPCTFGNYLNVYQGQAYNRKFQADIPIDNSSDIVRKTENILRNSYLGSNTRWWHRKILNLRPSTDTMNLQLHMEQFSLEKTKRTKLKPRWETLTHCANEKKSTTKRVGEAETQSCPKPDTKHSDSQSGGNSKPRASPQGVKDWNPDIRYPNF